MIAKLFYVICDGCGTPAHMGDDLMADSAREARKLSAREFTRVGGLDLCRVCVDRVRK